jgi:hypothetical protein
MAREYLAKRGYAKFKDIDVVKARCPLLGYSLDHMEVNGQSIGKVLLQPELQVEMGTEGYDKGAKMLSDFFKKELAKFDTPELDPLGKKILDMCMDDATLEDYINVFPFKQ